MLKVRSSLFNSVVLFECNLGLESARKRRNKSVGKKALKITHHSLPVSGVASRQPPARVPNQTDIYLNHLNRPGPLPAVDPRHQRQVYIRCLRYSPLIKMIARATTTQYLPLWHLNSINKIPV